MSRANGTSSNPANAARTLALDSSVTPDQLGLATTGATPQANGIANQLAALAGSSSAADQVFGAKTCTDHGMTPIQVMITRGVIEDGYRTRHWVVLCAKAALRR